MDVGTAAGGGKEPTVSCAACPPGMEGDGVLCRPRCFPACNAHQKCSVSECAPLEEDAVRQEEQKDLKAGEVVVVEDVDEEEEVVAALAVMSPDLSELPPSPAPALCDKPCRWVAAGLLGFLVLLCWTQFIVCLTKSRTCKVCALRFS